MKLPSPKASDLDIPGRRTYNQAMSTTPLKTFAPGMDLPSRLLPLISRFHRELKALPIPSHLYSVDLNPLLIELQPAYRHQPHSHTSLDDFLTLPEHRRLWEEVYLFRVAFLTTLRVLLTSQWSSLYGILPQGSPQDPQGALGFLNAVLENVMGFDPDAFSWLGTPTGSLYGWYLPTPELWSWGLSECNAAPLDLPIGTDFLGPLYEASLPTAGRKRQGQYYTPEIVIDFLLDRVGLQTGLFEADTPPRIYDPATGSAPFLLACARRMIQADSGKTPERMRQNLLQSLHGSEQDLFSTHLAKTSLLLTLARFVKTEKDAKSVLPLSITHTDSLTRVPPETTDDGTFDFVIGNPPYVGEKGNKALFETLLRNVPFWQPYYQARMDYLYFFILLGISKLKDGGRLAFITTRYWLTADGAETLRREILGQCKILEIIDCSELSLFSQATGQHNLMVILEKCDDAPQRNAHHPKWITPRKHETAGFFEQVATHPAQIHGWLDQPQFENPWVRVVTSAQPQRDMQEISSTTSQKLFPPWQWSTNASETAILDHLSQVGTALTELFYDQQGVISGADRLTPTNARLLSLSELPYQLGEGIFCLTEAELTALAPPESEQSLVKPFYKNSDVLPYQVHLADATRQFLLYTTPETSISDHPVLMRHLSRFQPILENKRECRTGKLPWYSLHWPRQAWMLEAEAIVTSRRAAFNSFAIAPAGWFENSDLSLLVPKPETPGSLAYYLGLLNSSLLDFWMAHRGKHKGNLREYYATPLRKIPLMPFEEGGLCREIEAVVLQLMRCQEGLLNMLPRPMRQRNSLKRLLTSQSPDFNQKLSSAASEGMTTYRALQTQLDERVIQRYQLDALCREMVRQWQVKSNSP